MIGRLVWVFRPSFHNCSVFCDYSVLVTLWGMAEVCFHLLGGNDFHMKREKERYMFSCGFALSSEPQI